MLTNNFIQYYRYFVIKYKSTGALNDIFRHNDTFLLRGQYKNKIKDVKDIPPKIIYSNTITKESINVSPFDKIFSGVTIKPNECQEKIFNYVDFEHGGSYLLNLSCGSGKTLIGLEFIHRLKAKTLIISTRSAVNDQWYTSIQKYYPDLKSKIFKNTKLKLFIEDYDIIITTPQYLVKYINDVQKVQMADSEILSIPNVIKALKVKFIIYDEIHSNLSEEFIKILKLPLLLKEYGIVEQIPYILGLTATLPKPKSIEMKSLTILFGSAIRSISDIIDIPIYYIDYRDLFINKGAFDYNYKPKNQPRALNDSINFMINYGLYPSIDYKLIIIDERIDDTVYSAIQSCQRFNIPVLIIRESTSKDYLILPNEIPDEYREVENLAEEDRPSFNFNEVSELPFMRKCKYQDCLNYVGIICGTSSRLKEGFNCENIVYGICTKFEYSHTSRVQLLGRIRRKSLKDDLNKHLRLFIVNSGVIPSTLKNPNRPKFKKPEILYDTIYEEILFKNENYINISNIEDYNEIIKK